MSVNCNACHGKITTFYFMECSKCNRVYDLKCLSISNEAFTDMTEEFKLNWLCPKCVCALPKSDNTSTPIRGAAPGLNNTYSYNINATRGSQGATKKTAASKGEDRDLPTALLQEIRELKESVHGILRQNSDLKDQLETVSTTLSHRLADFDKKLQSKDREITLLRSSVTQLTAKIDSQTQHLLRNELEIIGIPEQDNESLIHLVKVTSKKIGVTLEECDIDSAERVGNRATNSGNQNVTKSHRPIVLRLVRKIKRDEMLDAARKRRQLSTENIVSGPPSKLYLNERLTKENRQLFRAARLRAKLHNFRYCWIRNGTIFTRKDESTKNKKYPALAIRAFEDLDNLIGLPTPTIDADS